MSPIQSGVFIRSASLVDLALCSWTLKSPIYLELASNQTFLSSKNVVPDTLYSSSSRRRGIASCRWLSIAIGSSSGSLLHDVSGGGYRLRWRDIACALV